MERSVHFLGVTVIIFCYLAAPFFCQQHAIGRPLGPAGIVRATARVSCESSDWGPKCSDCNTILTCVGTFQVNQQTCTSLNPKRPYCSNNACVSTASNACASSTFRCTAVGQFPDPYDCTRYYFCSGKGLDKAYVYICPSGFVFESKSGLCRRTACQTINCNNNNQNKYVVFAADPSIMAYCLDTDSSKEIVLFRCPDSKNMQYDPTTLTCSYKCSAEGRFADRLDCHSFYECYQIGARFYLQHQKCPTRYSYDQVSKVCVRQQNCRNEIGGDGEEDDEASGGGPDQLLFY